MWDWKKSRLIDIRTTYLTLIVLAAREGSKHSYSLIVSDGEHAIRVRTHLPRQDIALVSNSLHVKA